MWILLAIGCVQFSTTSSLDTAESAVETTTQTSCDDVESTSSSIIDVEPKEDPSGWIFSVTVSSPDTGCDQYADWWEILSTSETLIYRRILNHSHVDEQPFTRSGEPINVSPTQTLVVRAHLNTGGYGQAMQGSITKGFSWTTLREDFAEIAESTEPLPTECWY